MKLVKNAININRKYRVLSYVRFISGGRSCVFLIPKIDSSYFRCADVQFPYIGTADSGVCPMLRAFALEEGCVTECCLIGSYKIAALYDLALPYYEGKDFVCIKLEGTDNSFEGGVLDYSGSTEYYYLDALYFACEDFYGSLPERYTIVEKDTDSFKEKVIVAHKSLKSKH